MDSRERLLVRVNDDLVVDAGTCERMTGPDGLERVVCPPDTPLFKQVLGYLQTKRDPERRATRRAVDGEGVAAAAVVLRWGSYFAVLADGAKPLWEAVRSPATSRISDEEMARINIEASAAMADWIDLSRADPERHARLVERAIAYLPMPVGTATPSTGAFWELSEPEHAGRLAQAAEQVWGAEAVARARAQVDGHPTRVLANAAVNVAWRNGPVEDIHAGRAQGYPLAERRVTPEEERLLMRVASDGMARAMAVCRRFAMEPASRTWPEQVLPYALAKMMLVTPTGWTLTEKSREVRLYHSTRSSPSAL